MRAPILAAPALLSVLACAHAAPLYEGDPPPVDPALFGAYAWVAHNTSAAEQAASPPKLIVLPAVPGADAGGLQGFVRVVNRNLQVGRVTIHAIDDTGRRFGPTTLRIGPWEAKHFNSQDLENGNRDKGLDEGVGNGTGWWRVELNPHHLVSFRAASYIRTPEGFVTSMWRVAEERRTSAGSPYYLLHFFNPARNTAIQSWLRIINPNDELAVVLVGAMDDTGYLAPPVTFPLLAGEAINLSAQQLEEGDPSIPFWEGKWGRGTGKWEASVIGSKPLQVMSLLATATGHVTNVTR